jgi:hypothetical protein
MEIYVTFAPNKLACIHVGPVCTRELLELEFTADNFTDKSELNVILITISQQYSAVSGH